MNNSKCSKCGLVNPAGDLACRRCGGLLNLPVRESVSEGKGTYPRYLIFLPFLLLAFGFGYWSNEIKKSAIAAMNVDKPEWHQLTMDNKVGPKDTPVETKHRDPFEGIKPVEIMKPESREEMMERSRRLFPDKPATSQPTPVPSQPKPPVFNRPR